MILFHGFPNIFDSVLKKSGFSQKKNQSDCRNPTLESPTKDQILKIRKVKFNFRRKKFVSLLSLSSTTPALLAVTQFAMEPNKLENTKSKKFSVRLSLNTSLCVQRCPKLKKFTLFICNCKIFYFVSTNSHHQSVRSNLNFSI